MPLWVREFTDGELASKLYEPVFAGFRGLDLVLLALIAIMALFYLARGRKVALDPPRSVLIALGAFCVALFFAFSYGAIQGGAQLFFDWRALALGSFYGVFIVKSVCRTPVQLRSAVWGLLTSLTIQAAYYLVRFLGFGSGTEVFGEMVPVFNGAVLTGQVFLATSAIALSIRTTSRQARLALLTAGALASLTVMLSFRRSFWGELIASFAVAFFLQKRGRWAAALTIISLVFVAFLQFGFTQVQDRVRSMNPFETGSPYTSTNRDHVNDLLDAWDAIAERPLTGIGVGDSYKTSRIARWKTDSWGVHNAILHVWLRYGALGLGAYLCFHLAVFWALYGLQRKLTGEWQGLVIGILSFLIAIFLAGLSFSPWPYGFTQITILTTFLMAAAFRLSRIEGAAFRNSLA